MTSTLPVVVIDMTYAVTDGDLTLSHRQRLRAEYPGFPVLPTPGTDPSQIVFETRGSGGSPGTVDAQTAFEAYVAALIPTLSSKHTIVDAAVVLFQNGLSGAGVYIAPFDLSNATNFPALTGTNGSKGEPSTQERYTFFDNRGRKSWLQLQENAAYTAQHSRTTYGGLSADGQGYIDYLVSANSWVRGAGNSVLLSFVDRLNGQNEANWRRRYR